MDSGCWYNYASISQTESLVQAHRLTKCVTWRHSLQEGMAQPFPDLSHHREDKLLVYHTYRVPLR